MQVATSMEVFSSNRHYGAVIIVVITMGIK